ncbi:sulfite exporter TauE/SafE family protein [Psychrobium sp. 1_MG-2023]|uniref:sulfite exporter TauE/SafE family protein n=1 Tax=Psychrobium sp. 1_MG-2023 TaxID=3062624 RepID=UPI000C3261E4|nr:sulfite exporter TauE/SafE family protein [Psychrobium sp. 1_MG-2023]MDP2561544.1 sulfite exporter TauE/SafE family protein [Psychrobium sp. 1_MG-2023]PKF55007.1 cytochrome biogenesis protein [Alteromonadales bacterium alter-6D02]
MFDATEYDFYAAVIVGLFSAGHCFGMCGGIVGAFSNNLPLHHQHALKYKLLYILSYNCGRIVSYCIAGALIGYSFGFFALKSAIFLQIIKLFSGLMLVVIGLYIGRWLNLVQKTEVIGKLIWPLIMPLGKRFIPFSTPLSAFPFGVIWGWLPCGLVYTTLTWAAASANATSGAQIMLGFGLGTLPALFALGLFSTYLNQLLSHVWFRTVGALLIICYGLNITITSLNMLIN